MMHVIEMKIDKDTNGVIRYTASNKCTIPYFKTQDDVDATCIYIRKFELQRKNSVPKNITVIIETIDKRSVQDDD